MGGQQDRAPRAARCGNGRIRAGYRRCDAVIEFTQEQRALFLGLYSGRAPPVRSRRRRAIRAIVPGRRSPVPPRLTPASPHRHCATPERDRRWCRRAAPCRMRTGVARHAQEARAGAANALTAPKARALPPRHRERGVRRAGLVHDRGRDREGWATGRRDDNRGRGSMSLHAGGGRAAARSLSSRAADVLDMWVPGSASSTPAPLNPY